MSNLRFRPDVHSLPRYVPGKSAPGAVKISSNEMPTPPSPAVLEAVARELETVNRYPDLTAAPLRERSASASGRLRPGMRGHWLLGDSCGRSVHRLSARHPGGLPMAFLRVLPNRRAVRWR